MEKILQVLKNRVGKDWYELLEGEFRSPYFQGLLYFIVRERKQYSIYPAPGDVFKAFKLTPLSSIKVVVVGQDPYHDGSATGLAFGTEHDNPSLQQIMRSLEFYEEFGDIQMNPSREPTLEYLAEQGVLLLNRVLTVRKRLAKSHRNKGWEVFTEGVIRALSSRGQIVFLLWGREAQQLSLAIDTKKNVVFTAEHPAASAYAKRAWKDNQCFQDANHYLEKNNKTIIKW